MNQTLVSEVQQPEETVIAAFLSFDGEPDLLPALTELCLRGARLALPVIQDGPGKSSIDFHSWRTTENLKANRYGIAEPEVADLIRVTEIDLALVPLVGWDNSGGRLGMGASFYDRLFQPYSILDKPRRIGVAYEMQKVEAVPCDPWDIPLHGMLTENGWFTFGG